MIGAGYWHLGAASMFPISDVIPSRTRPIVTIGLIAINTLVFLFQLQLDREQMAAFAGTWGFVPASPVAQTLLTSLFIHDGWIHFGGNMLYLWIFGDNVEDTAGHAGFALFYAMGGALAAGAHMLFNPGSPVPLIGASGAVAAVMGAYFVLYPKSQVLTAVFLIIYLDVIEIPAIFFLGIWFVMQLLSGLATMGAQSAGVGVAFGAHIAGFVAGTLTGTLLRRRERQWE